LRSDRKSAGRGVWVALSQTLAAAVAGSVHQVATRTRDPFPALPAAKHAPLGPPVTAAAHPSSVAATRVHAAEWVHAVGACLSTRGHALLSSHNRASVFLAGSARTSRRGPISHLYPWIETTA
jgi:hypothetical protein